MSKGGRLFAVSILNFPPFFAYGAKAEVIGFQKGRGIGLSWESPSKVADKQGDKYDGPPSWEAKTLPQ